MLTSKLILIDGISGSGKSTTAQFLASQLSKNGVNVKWYHETQNNHPLSYHVDVEVFESEEEVNLFLATIPKLWEQFVDRIKKSDDVIIVESFLLQDTVRILFQNNIEEERILDFVHRIEETVMPLNPVFFYFYQEDVNRSIRKIWERRGDEWKNWFIEADIQTPYVKNGLQENEEGVIQLWKDYQTFTNKLFKHYQFSKLSIENSQGDWENYYDQLLSYLGIQYIPDKRMLTMSEMERYCGTYKSHEDALECRIDIHNDQLVCDLIWPNIRVLPMDMQESKRFYLESFPVFFNFKSDHEGLIIELNLNGAKEDYNDKVLTKNSIT